MRFLSFGEIIYDIFPNGAVLGGAALNVAVHLARLGGESYLVSMVGADELGQRAIVDISSMGVKTKYIGLSSFDTSRADITLKEDGSASYSFNFPSAFDEIRLFPQEYKSILGVEWDGVVFGTLACRSDITKETLERLLDKIKAKEILFDVNLRGDFYSKDIIEYGISKATILKLNEEELSIISAHFEEDIDVFAKKLLDNYQNLNGIVITKGCNGICYVIRGGDFSVQARNTTLCDTVGAGDSVSAAFLYFLLSSGNYLYALDKAAALSGFVVSTKGALAEYSDVLIKELELNKTME